MEEYLIELLKEYGYVVLFFWSVLEGELGLIMAGIMSFTGDMILSYAILAGALGGFTGDQIYFYIGRFNKKRVLKKIKRKQLAKANLLLRKHGWKIVFLQRYLYGLRTVIPLTIGITSYDGKKYMILNLISAFIWATITISISYFYGEKILELITYLKEYKIELLLIGFFTFLVVYKIKSSKF